MLNAILGQKIDQTQTYTSEGVRIPVTHISVGPCSVVDIKTPEISGYSAIQLGFGIRPIKNTSKALSGVFKKAGIEKNLPRFLREIRLSNISEGGSLGDLQPGSSIKAEEVLKPGDKIQVTGVSKGKGFQGGVRRHHFKGGPRTHGQSDRERAPGSIGQTTTPGRVYKGKRMAGRMGNDQVTIKNLKVIAIDSEKNVLTVKGLVPGGRNGLLIIKKIN